MLRLHVIAHIVLPYKSLPIFGASGAKFQGYKSVLDDHDPGEVSMATWASLEGLVSSSSSGSLSNTLPRVEWKPPGYDA